VTFRSFEYVGYQTPHNSTLFVLYILYGWGILETFRVDSVAGSVAYGWCPRSSGEERVANLQVLPLLVNKRAPVHLIWHRNTICMKDKLCLSCEWARERWWAWMMHPVATRWEDFPEFSYLKVLRSVQLDLAWTLYTIWLKDLLHISCKWSWVATFRPADHAEANHHVRELPIAIPKPNTSISTHLLHRIWSKNMPLFPPKSTIEGL